ncbi:MAG: ribosome silencing factor [Bacillota bacterium]
MPNNPSNSNHNESKELVEKIVTWCKEKKAVNILSINLQGISLIGDYFLLLTVSNARQGQALTDYLKEQLKELGKEVLRTEGYDEARWILLDCGEVIIHIFQDEERKYYNLERLWGDAPIENYF